MTKETKPVDRGGVDQIAKALVKVQEKLQPATKDKENPFFKSSYADLKGVWDACRKLLAENGIAVVQPTAAIGGKNFLRTILIHTSGQQLESIIELKPVKDDPQSLGSAITYARRYCLAAMVGVVTEEDDDDGNAASDVKKSNQPEEVKYVSTDKKMASAKQRNFIFALGKKAGYDEAGLKTFLASTLSKQVDNFSTKSMTSDEASLVIEKLQAKVK